MVHKEKQLQLWIMRFHSKVENTRNTHICSIETLTLKEKLTFIDIDSVTVEYISAYCVSYNTYFLSLVVCACMAYPNLLCSYNNIIIRSDKILLL